MKRSIRDSKKRTRKGGRLYGAPLVKRGPLGPKSPDSGRSGKRNPAKTVRLRNFSGTITRKANGTVQIKGRAKRK